MIRKSITFKLFAILTIFFIAFTTATMILQSLFFSRFYLNTKTAEFSKNFKGMQSSAAGIGLDVKELPVFVQKFEDENNAQAAIVMMSNPIIITRMANIKALEYIQSLNQSGSPNVYKLPAQYKGFFEKDISLIATVKTIMLNNEILSQVVNEKKTLVYQSYSKAANLTNLTGVMPIVQNGKSIGLIVAVSSLQPIGEAASVIKVFYKYFYVLAVILIVLLALIFSKLVAKPLVNLNRAALKLADLDFFTRCDVNSEDEIGNLAKTINFLSGKLNDTLTELKNANEKLKQDIEQEKNVEKMRKEFIAGVSHELRTPISIIGGYAEGLKDIPDDIEKDYYLDVIVDETKKMEHLVSDMLDLSQLETGNFKLYIEEFRIADLLFSMIKKLSTSITNKRIVVNTKNAEENIIAFGDKLRIEQVVTNLLNNAIRYTEGGGRIFVSSSVLKDNVLIEIENEGRHIPEQELDTIWQKFYRIEKSRNKELGGTGMGLAIVANILKLHKSEYGVRNTPMGVKFYFTLKIRRSAGT